jgi:hypothetical protein
MVKLSSISLPYDPFRKSGILAWYTFNFIIKNRYNCISIYFETVRNHINHRKNIYCCDLNVLLYRFGRSVLKERVNHDIALSSRKDEVDRKKRRAADITHFLFVRIEFRLDFLSESMCHLFAKSIL